MDQSSYVWTNKFLRPSSLRDSSQSSLDDIYSNPSLAINPNVDDKEKLNPYSLYIQMELMEQSLENLVKSPEYRPTRLEVDYLFTQLLEGQTFFFFFK